MGCGASKEQLAAYDALRVRCEELELEREELENSLVSCERKSHEQLNLYRFKIEVMANMLSVEEKKQEATLKRLETLKLAMLTQGFTDKAMNTMLRGDNTPGKKSNDEKSILMTSAYDLSGAISRLTGEMDAGHAEDIIRAFANQQGKIVSHLSRDEFARYLYNSTENLTKSDVQILALRFYDGSTVIVPEFIDFFTMSSATRIARSAASAVRVSLNMLQLEDEDVKDIDEAENTEVEAYQSSNMKYLQASVDKLLRIWDEVEEPLIDEFMSLEEEIGCNQIVQFDTFLEILDCYCGERKAKGERKKLKASHDKWLKSDDIKLIACRFEVADRIDVKQFFNFFQDAYYSNGSQRPAVAPFQFSKEWSTLKRSAQQELAESRKALTIPADHQDESDLSANDEPEVEEIKPQPQKSFRSKNIDKDTKTKQDEKQEDKKPKGISFKSDKSKKAPLNEAKSAKNIPSKSPQKEKLKQPTKKKAKSNVKANTLIALYAKDPQSFESNLEEMSSSTGFIMTKEEFRETLKKATKDDNVSEADIDNVLSKLEFVGGTSSVSDLVKLLVASMSDESGEGDDSAPLDDAVTRMDMLEQGLFVNVRQEHIAETLESLRNAKLDTISQQYQQDPKAFSETLKVSTINNKTGVVDGKGNSITSASFNTVIRELVPNATRDEVDSLENDLAPNVRKDTHDILLSSIYAKLKRRIKEFNQTSSNISKQEKLLAAEEARNKRMEERCNTINELNAKLDTDSITEQYIFDSKEFMSSLKKDIQGKTIATDELVNRINNLVANVESNEITKLKDELGGIKDVPFVALEKVLKQRKTAKTNLLKQIEKEKKLLQKDLDIASTINDGGGCCGGSGKNVHDPNSTPQEFRPQAKDQTEAKDGKSSDKEHKPEDDISSDTNDCPKHKTRRSVPRLQSTMTQDTLTYSDNGDDKSGDDKSFDGEYGGLQLDRDKRKDLVPRHKAAARTPPKGNRRDFGKPRTFEDNTRVPSDGSDDDSLIFQAMKKK